MTSLKLDSKLCKLECFVRTKFLTLNSQVLSPMGHDLMRSDCDGKGFTGYIDINYLIEE